MGWLNGKYGQRDTKVFKIIVNSLIVNKFIKLNTCAHVQAELEFRQMVKSTNPYDPNEFEKLDLGEYYVHRQSEKNIDYEGYWNGKGNLDPDGVLRDKMQERDRALSDHKTELAYIKSLKPGKFLDVGCGLGWFLSGISDEWERHGIELSAFAAEKAREYGKIFTGELAKAKYPDAYFDAVICYHVIEHADDPVSLIAEIRRVIKPGGKFILGTPDFDSGCARHFGEKFRLLNDHTHISLFGEQGLRNILEDHGFAVEHVDKPFFETDLFTQENLNRLFDTEKVSPPFYGNIINLYSRALSKEEAREKLDFQNSCFEKIFGK